VKADPLRAQQAVARYGKAARHPLCLAALDLLRLDEELFKCTEEIELSEETVKRVKQMKENAQALIKQFHKERNEKEANQVSALLRRINRQLSRAQKYYEAVKKLHSKYQELRPWAAVRFACEYYAALCAGKKGALRALQRLRKRWLANEAHLKDGDLRKLETLNMLRKRVIEAKGAIDGIRGRYLEAARGGNRALSDEAWQGRLTARGIHSHIADACGPRVAGDKDAKEIRRVAKTMGIALAQDKPGRKWKWPPPPRESKQPLGRPRTTPDISFVKDVEAIQTSKAAAERGKIQRARIAAS
jgi:hypothetical protein